MDAKQVKECLKKTSDRLNTGKSDTNWPELRLSSTINQKPVMKTSICITFVRIQRRRTHKFRPVSIKTKQASTKINSVREKSSHSPT